MEAEVAAILAAPGVKHPAEVVAARAVPAIILPTWKTSSIAVAINFAAVFPADVGP
jgi:hypothetical protein